ncbi:MAG: SPOR domain-containing protein [Methyloceanibacter sp.]|uniref:SPOR domain-containing protein n=1 Tax=Methyloceanibacter sp. TaxID=1965321 RepID=UPI003D6CCE02
MALKSRRRGARNWARGIFAFFWIILAGFSGLYLYTLFTDPAALGSPTIQLSGIIAGDQARTGTTPVAPAPAAAPAPAGGASLGTAQLAELKASLQALSQQTAAIDARLKPIEKFIGPVAALPPASSVTTSPPAPIVPLPEEESAAPAPEVAVAEVEEETVVEAPAAPPPPVETPAAAPAPSPPVATEAPATEAPPAVAAAPMEDEAQPPASEAAGPAEAAEIASLDPVTLPPAANDGSTRYGIEIGIVAKRDELRPLWREYLTNHAALVAGLQPRRVLAPDKKWRLIAGPFANAQDAEGACTLFKKADRPCAATVYAGDGL